MRVYITDLEAYNCGHLVGNWYTLPMNEDLLAEAIENELQRGKEICNSDHYHEEFFITDYECDYLVISEYSSLTNLNEIAEKMEALDEQQQTAVKIMLENNLANDIDSAIENIDNLICTGEVKISDVAYNYVNDCGLLETMPENLQSYFDYDKLGRDMEIEGSYFEDSDGVLWEYVA
ncbi:antirestriction protein ArdA [Candidatus Sulfurimonas baltica]|uniref:Antirestriction protein ArdA n=1 Tax=Candidatus Sulfurimonas baltica TaxID=2740404 RepID=A0A7S7LVU1_9BACT|nr:antirestriction protein ArdA [Candidatus Sulfurimonas baltica]QOY52296.1 antirestriction protein ArdA [Candidatus Sulfurimonas baltica]